MSAHTPGPWAAHPQALLGVHQPKLQCWIPQNRADAMLIAAAPDLLEALQRLMGELTTMQDAMDANKQARAAIAKATGGAA